MASTEPFVWLANEPRDVGSPTENASVAEDFFAGVCVKIAPRSELVGGLPWGKSPNTSMAKELILSSRRLTFRGAPNTGICESFMFANVLCPLDVASLDFGDAARRFDEMLISEFDAETKKVFSCDAACRVTQNKRQAVELRLVRHHEHPVLNYHDDSHFKGKRFNFRTMQQTVHEVHAKNEVTGNGHRP
eukprot:scpid15577/ scgid10542/ 